LSLSLRVQGDKKRQVGRTYSPYRPYAGLHLEDNSDVGTGREIHRHKFAFVFVR
jgi:hypothetical protein